MHKIIFFLTSDTFILSVVQSITEFLPVSSTAHLHLIRTMLWKGAAASSSQITLQYLALHIGTILAVMVYFKNYFIRFLRLSFKPSFTQTLRWQLVVATLPIICAGLFLKNGLMGNVQNNLLLMACNLIGFGVLLYISDTVSDDSKLVGNLTYKDAFFIGCAQCLSLLPGVSRSGITMTAGRFCGLKRKDATRFSLLLSVPTVMAATGWVFFKLATQKHTYPWELVDTQFCLSVALTFLGGLIAIHTLTRWVKTHSFLVFMLYRFGLGLALLWMLGVI